MPTLSVPKNWASLTTPSENQLDSARESIETFTNVTKLGSDNISDNAVESSTIVNSSVTTARLGLGVVTTQKISDSAVTTAIIGEAMTFPKFTTPIAADKFGPINRAEVGPNGAALDNTTQILASVNITTSGRPVMVFVGAADTYNSRMRNIIGANGQGWRISILRDGSTIYKDWPGPGNVGQCFALQTQIPYSCLFIDNVSAGSYTYQIQSNPAASFSELSGAIFRVVEL